MQTVTSTIKFIFQFLANKPVFRTDDADQNSLTKKTKSKNTQSFTFVPHRDEKLPLSQGQEKFDIENKKAKAGVLQE